MKNNYYLFLLFFSLIFGTSCSSDSESVKPKGTYSDGVIILNQGQFGTPNGSLSFLKTTSLKLDNQVFKLVNGRPLGDVVQSAAVAGNKILIAVNNSNKIEVCEAGSLKALGSIPAQQPRYFAVLNEQKAYVTEWSGGYAGIGQVSVIDLTTNTLIKKIAVGIAPEHLIFAGSKLLVANSGEATISVINTTTDLEERKISVADGPGNMVSLGNKIYLLCAGKAAWTGDPKPGTLTVISASDLSTSNFVFPSGNPGNLCSDPFENKLYFSNKGSVYAFTPGGTLPGSKLIPRSFYGLACEPATGRLYATDAGDFTNPGKLIRFERTGAAIDSFQVGIAPGELLFVD